MFKHSKKFINVATNETHQEKTLPTSPTCLVYSLNPSLQTQLWLSALERHLIVVEAGNCRDVLASQFNVDLYCVEGNIVYEKYSIRSKTVFRKLERLHSGFPISIYNKKLERRSDLQGVELIVTTLNTKSRAIEGAVHGPPGTGKVTGYFGDLFMILKNKLNFTFTLQRPKDNKWGGKDDGRKFGWNGMIGDVAEGLADFGIGAFTSTPERNEVVRFSIGNLDIEKTFYLKRDKLNTLNLTLFTKPFKGSTWLAVIGLIIVVGLVFFIIIHIVKDKQALQFNLRRSLIFSFSGITFIRRWSVTPVSLSARIVFISVLYVGIIVQGMWKASFTSVLAVKKEVVPYNNLEDLMKAGITITVQAGSSSEGNFR